MSEEAASALESLGYTRVRKTRRNPHVIRTRLPQSAQSQPNFRRTPDYTRVRETRRNLHVIRTRSPRYA